MAIRAKNSLRDFPIDRRQGIQFTDLVKREESGMIHFTAVGLRLTADEPQKHHDIDAVTLLRIVAVTQSQNSLHLSHHPGFFLHLAHDRLLNGLVGFNKPAGELPVASTVTRGPANHEKLTPAHDGSADSDVISCIVSFWYRHRANLAQLAIAYKSASRTCQASNACCEINPGRSN